MSRPADIQSVSIMQRCDNSTCVGAKSKDFSMKVPLNFALRALALLAFRRRLHVHISHHAGVRNEWADQASRLNERHAHFVSLLDPAKRKDIPLQALLALCSIRG